MNFSLAINEMLNGKGITRKAWDNPKIYCLLLKDRLTIFNEGIFHTWTVSREDLVAEDWTVV